MAVPRNAATAKPAAPASWARAEISGGRVTSVTLRLTTGDEIVVEYPRITINFGPARNERDPAIAWLEACGMKAEKAMQNAEKDPVFRSLVSLAAKQEKLVADCNSKLANPPAEFRRDATVYSNYRNTLQNFLSTAEAAAANTTAQIQRRACAVIIAQSGLQNYVRQ